MQQPYIFYENQYSVQDIERFKVKHKPVRIVDIYARQFVELQQIAQPGSSPEPEIDVQVTDGVWVYYPWSGILLHTVGEEKLFALRTNRNKNLIIKDDQATLAKICVGVCGLSVGNSIALTLAYSGFSDTIKLADYDVVETANLNRLRVGLSDIGEKKTHLAARQIWELNPFAKIQLFDNGIDDTTIDRFFSDPQPRVVFDEIDDFPMKIKLRLKAQELGIPIIMLTSLGDNILIDVERYDSDRTVALFNGRVEKTVIDAILQGTLGEREKVQYAIDLVGAEHIPVQALESLFEINKTLVGRPQLASTIATDGGIGAMLVRKLVLGEDVPSGRYYLSLAKAIGLRTMDDRHKRKAVIEKLDRMLGR